MTERAEFMGLVLDGPSLITPEGTIPVSALTRASFIRDLDAEDAQAPAGQAPVGAVVGGAVVGGVLFGVPGAVGGALVGSVAGKEDVTPTYRGSTVHVVFETAEGSYTLPVPREQEHAGYEFVQQVKKAMKR